jgi:hypothetical protein
LVPVECGPTDTSENVKERERERGREKEREKEREIQTESPVPQRPGEEIGPQ